MSIPIFSRDLQVETSQIIPVRCPEIAVIERQIGSLHACVGHHGILHFLSPIPIVQTFSLSRSGKHPPDLYHGTSHNIVDWNHNSIYPSPVTFPLIAFRCRSPLLLPFHIYHRPQHNVFSSKRYILHRSTSCPTSDAAASHASSHKCASLSVNKLPLESDLLFGY